MNILKLFLLLLINFIFIFYSLKYPANPYKFDSEKERELVHASTKVKVIKEFNFEQKININTADVKELVKLKGIGTKKAKLIIAYRKKHGKFKETQELKQVSGISSSVYKNIKDYITL